MPLCCALTHTHTHTHTTHHTPHRYYVVTGRYPFEGSTVYTLFENIAKAEYQIPPSLDPDLVELIRGMLHPDKNKRFSLDAISSHKYLPSSFFISFF